MDETVVSRPVLLVVDADLPILRIVGRLAAKVGFEVVTCTGGSEALRGLMRQPADLALVDLSMPDVNGLELRRQIRSVAPGCEVILMTGDAAVDRAVGDIKPAARDYVTKPIDFERLRQLLIEIRDERERRSQILELESNAARPMEYCGMLGRSPGMQEVFNLIRRLAPHAKVVLISGETGTGKELAARAFHQAGPRRAKPFVTINCSAVVDGLFESELFGHVQGAYSGADEAKAGLFERADGGTLFLDEIGELPPGVQAKLLRSLENGEAQRIGSLRPRTVDVAVVAATNRDLRAEVAAGRFRNDLFVLRKVSGNRMAAAKVLGISRRALYRRLDRHHIGNAAAHRTIRRRA